jgi:TonB family protein
MDTVRYPQLLRQAGIEGTVVVSLAVRPDGSVDPASVQIVSATNRAFERPARDAARTARYAAGDRAGPVAVQLTVHFRLADGL